MADSTNERFWFTAGKLIEVLKDFPEDMPVVISGYESGFENLYQPEVIRVKHCPDNFYYEGEFQDVDDDEKEKTFEVICLQRNLRND